MLCPLEDLTFATVGGLLLIEAMRALTFAGSRRLLRSALHSVLADAVEAHRAESKLEDEREKIIERGPKSLLISAAVASYMREASATRRRILEEKARANLTALAISASFSTSGIALATAHPRIALILIVPLFSFGLAAYASVRVLQVGQVFVLTVEQELAGNASLDIVWFTEMNDTANSMKANWVSVSYKAFRNAVICLVCTVGIAILSLFK